MICYCTKVRALNEAPNMGRSVVAYGFTCSQAFFYKTFALLFKSKCKDVWWLHLLRLQPTNYKPTCKFKSSYSSIKILESWLFTDIVCSPRHSSPTTFLVLDLKTGTTNTDT